MSAEGAINQSQEGNKTDAVKPEAAKKEEPVADLAGKWKVVLQQEPKTSMDLIIIQTGDRLQGYGTEAYRAVGDRLFSEPEVKRIGTLLIPQFDASLRFAENLGFERAGGPFKNKRGYGLYSFVKKRPGEETPGEEI